MCLLSDQRHRRVEDQARRSPQLLDAQGNALSFRSSRSGSEDGSFSTTVQVACIGAGGRKAGPPVKFVWKVPVEMKTLTLPIEFADLPLP
jgi:hypothetical protein